VEGTTKYQKLASEASIPWMKRCTVMFKWDAVDKSGNHAEQAVVVLVLNDLSPPKIYPCRGTLEKVQAAGGLAKQCPAKWYLCSGTKVTDNIDSNARLTRELKYSVKYQPSLPKNAGWKYLVQLGSFKAARAAITTNHAGKYIVTFTVHDHAGIYGRNYRNNYASAYKTVIVYDLQKPWLTITGATTKQHECGHKYTDLHATGQDCLDTIAWHANKPEITKLGRPKEYKIMVTATGIINKWKKSHQHVCYTGSDRHGNVATQKCRHINVKDTTSPTHTLRGKKIHVIYAGQPFVDHGTTCVDLCDRSKFFWSNRNPVAKYATSAKNTRIPIDMHFKRPYNNKVAGDYVRCYDCKDKARLTTTICRTFRVVDKKIPIVTRVGCATQIIEASRKLEYTDKGAICHDRENGNLDHAVFVSGQIVNRAIPGTYKIKYDCMDISHNKAYPVYRTVIVRDTTCPRVSRSGSSLIFLEAGFSWKDTGHTCYDNIDLKLTGRKCWTSGDTVNTRNQFLTRRSCRAIQADIKAREGKSAKSGKYWISVANNVRRQVTCDFHTKGGPYTLYPCRNCNRKIDQCKKLGMTRIFAGLKAHKKYEAAVRANFARVYSYAFKYNNYYVCTSVQKEYHPFVPGFDDNRFKPRTQHARAEVGKFVIQYHAQDKSGNTDQKCYHPRHHARFGRSCGATRRCISCNGKGTWRTVIVKDTLPPVISLVMVNPRTGKKAIHVGNHNPQKGIRGETNPAYKGVNGIPKKVPIVGNYFPKSKADGWVTKAGMPANPNPTGKNWEDHHKSKPHQFDFRNHKNSHVYMAEQAQSGSVNAWIVGAVASGVTGLALLAYGMKK
jgi:hypothetical protein